MTVKNIKLLKTNSYVKSRKFLYNILQKFEGNVLLITTFKNQAEFYKNSLQIDLKSLNLNFNCFSLSDFIEDCPYVLIEHEKQNLKYVDSNQKLLILLNLIINSNVFKKINLSLATSLFKAINEIKSNDSLNLDVNNLSLLSNKCKLVLDFYKQIQEYLNKNKLYDYYDKILYLISDKNFYNFLSTNYNLVIFDRLEYISPLEIKFCSLLMSKIKNVVYITDFTKTNNFIQDLIFKEIISCAKKFNFNITVLDNDIYTIYDNKKVEFDGIDKSIVKESGFVKTFSGETYNDEINLIAKTISHLILNENIDLSKVAIYVPNLKNTYKYFENIFNKYNIQFSLLEKINVSDCRSIINLKYFLNFLKLPSDDTFIPLITLSIFNKFIPFLNLTNLNSNIKKFLIITKIFNNNEKIENLNEKLIQKQLILEKHNLSEYNELLKTVLNFKLIITQKFFDKNHTLVSFFNEILMFLNEYGFNINDFNQFELNVLDYTLNYLNQFIIKSLDYFNLTLDKNFIVNFLIDLIDTIFISNNNTSSNKLHIISHGSSIFNEYDYIFIPSLVENNLPSLYLKNLNEFIDENDRKLLKIKNFKFNISYERSIFHKVISLSKKGVFLSYPKSHLNSLLLKSRFLNEIINIFEFNPLNLNTYSFNDFIKFLFLNYNIENFSIKEFLNLLSTKVNEKILTKIKREIEFNKNAYLINGLRDSYLINNWIFNCSNILPEQLLSHIKSQDANTNNCNDILRISPTIIEKFYYCPAMYFFDKLLNLSSEKQYTYELEAIDEGNILHKILENFFKNNKVINLIENYYYKNDTNIKNELESELLKIGILILNEFELKNKFGENYYNIKKIQYFNGLFGFDETINGISGYFKDFLDNYLEFLKLQNVFLKPVATEFNIDIMINIDKYLFQIMSKCDRIDILYHPKIDGLSYIVHDYKTTTVPQLDKIIKRIYLQAPFYIYFLNQKLTKEITYFKKIFNMNFSNVQNSAFIYTSLSKFDQNNKPKQFIFIANDFAIKKSKSNNENESENQSNNINENLKLIVTQSPCEEFYEIVNLVPQIIIEYITKLKLGFFHCSVIKNHNCSGCDFNKICYRSEKALLKFNNDYKHLKEIHNGIIF